MNRNSEIDWHAYSAVRRGLAQLLQKEEIEEAKALAADAERQFPSRMQRRFVALVTPNEAARTVLPAIARLICFHQQNALPCEGLERWGQRIFPTDAPQFIYRSKITHETVQ